MCNGISTINIQFLTIKFNCVFSQ